jgi:hypothetical protein
MEPQELFSRLIDMGLDSGLDDHIVMTVMLKIATNLALDCGLSRGDFLQACNTSFTVEHFFRPESDQLIH